MLWAWVHDALCRWIWPRAHSCGRVAGGGERRRVLELQINEFGQIPLQLFAAPHPRRLPGAASRPLLREEELPAAIAVAAAAAGRAEGDAEAGGDGAAIKKLGVAARIAVRFGRRLGLLNDPGQVARLSERYMPIGDDVVVIGGGLVGAELTEFLVERGRNVTVVEEGEKFALEMAHPRRWRVLYELRESGVELVPRADVGLVRGARVGAEPLAGLGEDDGRAARRIAGVLANARRRADARELYTLAGGGGESGGGEEGRAQIEGGGRQGEGDAADNKMVT